jgi:8-oxo-dGTP pyrophosphatase MutT (NUDIX family)
MSSHAGQPAFPGGRIDPDDDGPVAAELREAVEETGVDPQGVVPLISMPELFLPVSDHLITPVVAWWREPSPVGPVDPRETAEVVRVPVQALADPANRFRVRHSSGYTGPAFLVDGFLVWGWTGGVVTYLLRVGGWTRPWDSNDVRELDAVARRAQT